MPRVIMLLILLATAMSMTRSEPLVQAREASSTRIVATPVSLSPDGGRDVGALRFRRGWVLTSADPRFGGLSAMMLVPDGFLAISDAGTAMWIAGPGRRPASLRLQPLPQGPGDGARKADRDSEALARDRQGRVWIAFERHNSLWRYTPDLVRAQAHRAPPEMARWRENSGAEAMLRLADGRFLVFSEGAGGVPRSSDALLFNRDPVAPDARAIRVNYRLPAGFAVTDVADLGDGRVLTLHRSFSLADGAAASLGVAPVAAFRDGATVEPRILATLRPPLTVDNMEALAVERRGGRTRVWIASDDNFNTLQRTLLLEFDLRL